MYTLGIGRNLTLASSLRIQSSKILQSIQQKLLKCAISADLNQFVHRFRSRIDPLGTA